MITPEQYEHWKDFALRMARTCFKHRRRPDTKEILENVEEFFECLDPDYLKDINEWDDSDNNVPYVTDLCEEMEENWNPYYWSDLSDAEWERRNDQFCVPVMCCIRAGLDMAVATSGGVIGFTAGDLRKMYPDDLPDWVTGGKDNRWSYWLKAKLNGTFAEMPNEAQLVL